MSANNSLKILLSPLVFLSAHRSRCCSVTNSRVSPVGVVLPWSLLLPGSHFSCYRWTERVSYFLPLSGAGSRSSGVHAGWWRICQAWLLFVVLILDFWLLVPSGVRLTMGFPIRLCSGFSHCRFIKTQLLCFPFLLERCSILASAMIPISWASFEVQ
jgi:hypothetical protein